MHANDRLLTFIGFRPTGDYADLTAYTSKRGKPVWFQKAPPLKPPSLLQLRHRQMFRNAALGWRTLTQEKRDAWNKASRRCHLDHCGYLLFLVWILRPDRPAIATVERQSGITLL